MSSNTQNQYDANDFDMKLFHLIDTAGYRASRSDAPTTRKRWEDVRALLMRARPKVREMMSSADQFGTQ